MSFLNENAQSHFIDALKFSLENTSKSRIKSDNSLRRTLEEFLRFKLNTTSGLEGSIKTLGKSLKETNSNDDPVKKHIIETLRGIDLLFN